MGTMEMFLERYTEEIISTILVVYILVLGIGAVGELFHIQWIVHLPPYKL